ncbi:excinuclease ABC subunit UvrC [Jiulongibacter sediminis]|uniref:UvrABC system protein C n=1 Tax=Jiulongibacter sediminis TaxID=1605367 RepID=A0A0P7C434_9BACT|nr:excinuclease ABC subunit UvrC [Jiulongibacter sediminis]KPM49421.1 excinuclease ABC subunit C [Jiulongibacter sediminis]TBX26469.1 excinuclease ABC subunit C [Jiulongibacter sediminis]
MASIKFDYKTQIPLLPNEPGIYKYFDHKGTIIYVGKAKNLKNRISSYFYNFDRADRKTKRLVMNIHNLEYTVVHSEYDALLLENNMIKELQPKFNIMLKDDKNYPYICVTNERFPRLVKTRQIDDRKKGKMYGPYVNVKAMHALLDMFTQLYTIRTCKYVLSEENVAAHKFKLCLEYHIGNCLGPCEGLQEESDYLKEIEQVHHILKGNIAPAKEYFQEKMEEAAISMAFEKAHEFKQKLEFLQNYQSKATVVNPSISDADVFGIQSDADAAYICYLKISNGTITQTQTFEVKKKLEEPDDEILEKVMFEVRQKYESKAKEIFSNIELDTDLKAQVVVPKIGDKKKLIEMSLRNIMYYRHEKAERDAIAKSGATNKRDRVLIKLKQDLQLKELPRHIECFDNSNIQGTNPVSAMVLFRNGQPSKKEYRHYIPRTVTGPDDFGTMKEVVFRRYKRLLEEKEDLPDLIVIDGGKGQLSASVEALKELDLYGKIPIIGIAKRLEEIYFPEDTLPLYIDKKSESLKLIQRARDEAHRFGITHHRNRRSKGFLISSLEGIPGIGKPTATKILKHFKTIQNIRNASDDELIEILGKHKTKKIRDFLKEAE